MICSYCDAETPVEFLTRDHFVPRSEGGTFTPGNKVLACQICNRLKSHFVFATIEEARECIERRRRLQGIPVGMVSERAWSAMRSARAPKVEPMRVTIGELVEARARRAG